jgi:hypothetical protein
MNDAYWSWLERQETDESEGAAASGDSVALLDRPEIELEPPVPTGFESFWA